MTDIQNKFNNVNYFKSRRSVTSIGIDEMQYKVV